MTLFCSFCGEQESDSIKIVEGAKANICEPCSSICIERFDEINVEANIECKRFLKPHEIKIELDKYIIGQDEAKRVLSVAVYNHYKRVNIKSKVDIQKTNILIIGPTGSGKTYLMQTLAQIMDVPIVIADATSLTEAGYVGEDVESILEKLIRKANGDISKAERGIVYIDEIDKIATKSSGGRKNGKDIGGEGVQQALLKMVEDSEINVPTNDERKGKSKILMNTKNILFVCGGAFNGINDIIEKRTNSKTSKAIGFSNSEVLKIPDIDKTVMQKDIVDFGLIPELVGRLPVITMLHQLSKQNLTDILVKPKNAILKQYKELLKMDGVKIDFSKNAIEFIVEEALKKDIGARGLRGVIDRKMNTIMFEMPKHQDVKKYTITREVLTTTVEDMKIVGNS